MKGLRTQESEKFKRFFQLIQKEAEKQDCVFFAHAGDGHEFESSIMECEDMMGWLIPNEDVSLFEPDWKADRVKDSWTERFRWAVWSNENGKIKIRFDEF